MNNIKYFFAKHKDIIFLFLLSLVPLLWYGFDGTKMIAGHDAGYPFNPFELVKERMFAWSDGVDFGISQIGYTGTMLFHGLEAIITFLTGSLFVGQKIYVMIWFFLPMAAMYYLVKKLPVLKEKPYMGMLAAVLYQFNFFQFQGWIVFWRTRFSIYVALPIFFLLIIEYFEGRRNLFKTSLFIGLIFFFFNGGGSPPLFGSIILLFLVTVVYYLFLNLSHWFGFLKKSILLILSVLVVTLLVSAYWVIPYVYFALTSYAGAIAAGGGPALMLGWTDEVSRNASIVNLLRLQGLDIIETASFNDTIKIFLTNPFLVAVSFLWPVLAFGSMLLAKIKEKRYIMLLSLTAIVAIPFTAASHAPFREFYLFLLQVVPGFPIFRTALYKFGGLLWFSYALLAAFSLSSIIEIVKTKLQKSETRFIGIPAILSSLFIFFILAFHFPIFNNRLFQWNPPLTTLVEVPQYIFDFGNWMDKQDISERILLLPKLNDTWHAEAFTWGYWSLSPVTSFLTRKNFISNDSALVGPEMVLLNDLYKNLEDNNSSWLKLTGALGIKYLLLRNDFFSGLHWSPSTSPVAYREIIEGNDNVEKVKEFGQWVLYKINNDTSYVPVIYSPDSSMYSYTPESTTAEVFRSAKTNRPLVIFGENQGNLAKEPPLSLVQTTVTQAECVVCDPSETSLLEDEIHMPLVRSLPGSVFYPLVRWKEKRLLNAYTDIPSARIDADLGFAGKRLSEIGLILSNKAKGDKKILIQDNSKQYSNEINDALEQIQKLSEKEKNNYLRRMLAYLNVHAKFLEEKLSPDDSITYKELPLFLQRTIRDLSKNVWMTESLTQKKYVVEIHEAGNYAVIMKNQDIAPQEFLIDGKKTGKNVHDVFLEKGHHTAELMYSDFPNLLLSGESSSSGKFSLGQGDATQFGIRDFDFRSKYYIAFNYRVSEGKAPVFLVTQDNDNDNKEGEKNRALEVALSSDGKWHNFTYAFSPNSGAREAVLSFYQTSSITNTVLEINTFTVEKIFTPQIFFTSETLSKELTMPRITFRKINPTEYVVHVEHATGPYLLTFGQRYDSGWNVYLFDNPIPEKNHFQANGYANSWYIDTSGTYDLFIRYWPQRLYYVGLAVSFVTLLTVLAGIFLWKK